MTRKFEIEQTRAAPKAARVCRARHTYTLGALTLLTLLIFAPSALAGPPSHLRSPALDVAGLDHACGVAVDSKGDLYLASAGESKVKVFDPSHTELTSIANANEPCALAVTSKGELYVSERATGNVVRYKPNAYPFSGSPSYGAAEAIDSSGKAKGISVDPHDDRLYVAEGDRVSVYSPAGALDTVNEEQSVKIEATGGTFKLIFEGAETGSLPYNASAAEVEAALKALPTIGAGNVEVKQSETSYFVTFTGSLASTDVELLKGDSSGLTGGGSNKLIIEEKVKGFNGHIGEGELSGATGIAPYTYVVSVTKTFKGEVLEEKADRYLFVAEDGGSDRVKVLSGAVTFNSQGTKFTPPKLRRTITGVDHDRNPETPEQSFGFGAAGAYLAVDPGNRLQTDPETKKEVCKPVADQACTAGHLLLYDAAHSAVDELEASGEFLDQLTSEAFADAQPTAIAVDRSGGPGDGTIYASAGDGPAAKALAFGPLAAPSRAPAPALSHVLPGAQAVATDSHGDLYVAAGAQVHVYDPSGAQLTEFEDAEGAEDLAVDSSGKVYVDDNAQIFKQGRVTYYTPSAYPPVSGTTYARHEPPIAIATDFPSTDPFTYAIAVNPKNDHLFVTAGTHTHEYDSAAKGSGLLNAKFAEGLSLELSRSIGVDGGSGNVYFGGGGSRIFLVDAAGTEVLARINGAGGPKGQLGAAPRFAVDQSNGHALAFEPGEAAREYDAAGGFVAEFGQFTSLVKPYRIAIDNACALHDPPLSEATTPTCAEFDPSNGNVYVAFDDTAPKSFDLTAFGPLAYGEAPQALTGTATAVGGGGATLNGTLNPRGFEASECQFEYLPDAQYIANGKTFAAASSTPCAESLAAIGKGSSPVAVHAELTGLDPEARYRFRLLAANKYGESLGKAGLFGAPVITTKPALPILYHEATLRAEIDPSGLQSEYRFEYGKAAGQYDQSTPTTQLAPGDGAVAVGAALGGLAEGTTYHFRVLAENEAQSVQGPDQTLLTLQHRPAEDCENVAYRSGLSAQLPDCRAYELLTPAETNGLSPQAPGVSSAGSAVGFNNWLATPRGPGAGESLAYFTFGTLPGFEGNGLQDGYRARRGAGEHPPAGWSNELFGPSYPQAVPSFLRGPAQEGVASDQLYSFWLLQPEEAFEGTLPEGVYLGTPDVVAGSQCNPTPSQGRFELVGCGALGSDPKAIGDFLSAGGAHVIFSSKAQLEEAAAPAGTNAVYDRPAGSSSAEVLSLAPDGSPFGAGESAAYVASTEDGSATLFKVAGTLYLHREGATVEVAKAPNAFAGISEDGERLFYAAGDGAKPNDLFAFDVDTETATEIAEDSIFLNVSPEGSHAFFSSEEALTGAEENEAGEVAEAGERNLYAWEAEASATSFIARLDPRDFKSFAGEIVMNLGLWTEAINPSGGRGQSPARATPGGEVFVFQSHAQLSAYENEGAGEIYRYQPAAAPGERLLCVSCDPSGAPPGGDALLQAIRGTGVDESTMITNVTDDGQEIFFQSADRLLPEDANAAFDVYEWRAKSAGECKRDGGCLALISSGQGDVPSYLYAMSAEGHDVFFSTREKLIGADVAGSPSIYDARVGGGIPDPPPPAPCQGDACQGQGSSPPALHAPASTGAGEGNVEGRPARCAKGKHRVKGRCVKGHRKHRHANHKRKGHR